MRRRHLLLLTVFAAACGGADTATAPATLPATDANVVGTFQLTLAAGQPLPIVISSNSAQELDMTSDVMDIRSDNSWVETTTYQLYSFVDGSSTAATTPPLAGTYSIGNGQINFVVTSDSTHKAPPFSGSVTGNTLTLLSNRNLFIYTR